MLVIRLTRVGKTNEAAYRIVVADKRNAVKGDYNELVGFYHPAENKKIDFKKDRIEYWISKGARPSDTLASLLKLNGVSGMEKFMAPRNLKRKRKKGGDEAAAPSASAAPVAAAVAEAPEAPVQEVAAETPAVQPAESAADSTEEPAADAAVEETPAA